MTKVEKLKYKFAAKGNTYLTAALLLVAAFLAMVALFIDSEMVKAIVLLWVILP